MSKNNKELQLNTQQKLFCIEYLVDWNATQAATRAGYSKKSARAIGVENLTKPAIQNEIKEQIKLFLEKAKIPLEKKILDYWLVRAFYNINDIIDLNGNIKLTEEELREKGLHVVIDGINKKVNDKGIVTIQYKWADKDKAVEMLQKYVGMIKEDPPPIQQNNTYVDIKALVLNQAKDPKDKERIIAELEKLTDN